MPRGGKRAGAGRKKGSRNRSSELQRLHMVMEGDVLPLDYMLAVMRDERQPYWRRDEMAKAAAPYCHARLAILKQQGINDNSEAIETIEHVVTRVSSESNITDVEDTSSGGVRAPAVSH